MSKIIVHFVIVHLSRKVNTTWAIMHSLISVTDSKIHSSFLFILILLRLFPHLTSKCLGSSPTR